MFLYGEIKYKNQKTKIPHCGYKHLKFIPDIERRKFSLFYKLKEYVLRPNQNRIFIRFTDLDINHETTTMIELSNFEFLLNEIKSSYQNTREYIELQKHSELLSLYVSDLSSLKEDLESFKEKLSA